VRGPRAVLAWLRGGAPTRLGHNPLGALSVVAMLALLLAQALTGLTANASSWYVVASRYLVVVVSVATRLRA
jgi:cytochrome b